MTPAAQLADPVIAGAAPAETAGVDALTDFDDGAGAEA
jgi:hypothetical protein